MRILALDVGNAWTGTAITDPLKMFAKPHKTVARADLMNFLETCIPEQKVDTVIVGYPKTMRGTESQQTKETVEFKEECEKKFSNVKWILWDERLSSKQATTIKKPKNKADKLEQHSIAAAIILQTYLQFHNQSIY